MAKIPDITIFSREAGEPLRATAPQAGIWLLLEYTKAWGEKAVAESDLPETVKAYLSAQTDALPGARVQFIKQDEREHEGITFFVARTGLQQPFLYRFRLNDYEELLKLDIRAIATARSEQTLSDEQLFLICTNGKRDPACSRYGLPLYRAFRELAGASVWQSDHLGGHRFAATMVCLPRGIYYGRVTPEQASVIVEAERSGEIALDFYRGCSAYNAPTQAAEDFLRGHTGHTAVDAFELVELEADGDQRWRVVFRAGRQRYEIRVRAQQSEFVVYEGTHKDAPQPMTQYLIESFDMRIV
ncbi:MAG: sucrase ferredoxin [Anaerolineae bacterium]|nr:sucrase ferredoxin [Anaerolineae bacterium]